MSHRSSPTTRLVSRRRAKRGGAGHQPFSTRLLALGSLVLAGALPIAAQTGAGESEERLGRTAERIFELQREIDRLRASLSPEELQELERRLALLEETSADESEAPPDRRGDDRELVDLEVTGEPAGSAPTSSTPSTHRTGGGCRGLEWLDSNDDGVISGSDRFWRHLYLWSDDGDGQLEKSELRSVYELGVRQIELHLRHYTTVSGAALGIDRGRFFELPLVTKKRRDPARGALTIDAAAVAKADGIRLFSADGSDPHEGGQGLGLVALHPGLVVARGDQQAALECN